MTTVSLSWRECLLSGIASLSHGKKVEDIEIKFYHTVIKPLHAKWLTELSYVNLNLVKCQLQNISQQKDIENGILLPISSGIFSSLHVPNLKPLFLGFDTSLNYGTEKFRTLRIVKYYIINKFNETIPITANKKRHQKLTCLGHSKKNTDINYSFNRSKTNDKKFEKCKNV